MTPPQAPPTYTDADRQYLTALARAFYQDRRKAGFASLTDRDEQLMYLLGSGKLPLEQLPREHLDRAMQYAAWATDAVAKESGQPGYVWDWRNVTPRAPQLEKPGLAMSAEALRRYAPYRWKIDAPYSSGLAGLGERAWDAAEIAARITVPPTAVAMGRAIAHRDPSHLPGVLEGIGGAFPPFIGYKYFEAPAALGGDLGRAVGGETGETVGYWTGVAGGLGGGVLLALAKRYPALHEALSRMGGRLGGVVKRQFASTPTFKRWYDEYLRKPTPAPEVPAPPPPSAAPVEAVTATKPRAPKGSKRRPKAPKGEAPPEAAPVEGPAAVAAASSALPTPPWVSTQLALPSAQRWERVGAPPQPPGGPWASPRSSLEAWSPLDDVTIQAAAPSRFPTATPSAPPARPWKQLALPKLSKLTKLRPLQPKPPEAPPPEPLVESTLPTLVPGMGRFVPLSWIGHSLNRLPRTLAEEAALQPSQRQLEFPWSRWYNPDDPLLTRTTWQSQALQPSAFSFWLRHGERRPQPEGVRPAHDPTARITAWTREGWTPGRTPSGTVPPPIPSTARVPSGWEQFLALPLTRGRAPAFGEVTVERVADAFKKNPRGLMFVAEAFGVPTNQPASSVVHQVVERIKASSDEYIRRQLATADRRREQAWLDAFETQRPTRTRDLFEVVTSKDPETGQRFRAYRVLDPEALEDRLKQARQRFLTERQEAAQHSKNLEGLRTGAKLGWRTDLARAGAIAKTQGIFKDPVTIEYIRTAGPEDLQSLGTMMGLNPMILSHVDPEKLRAILLRATGSTSVKNLPQRRSRAWRTRYEGLPEQIGERAVAEVRVSPRSTANEEARRAAEQIEAQTKGLLYAVKMAAESGQPFPMDIYQRLRQFRERAKQRLGSGRTVRSMEERPGTVLEASEELFKGFEDVNQLREHLTRLKAARGNDPIVQRFVSNAEDELRRASSGLAQAMKTAQMHRPKMEFFGGPISAEVDELPSLVERASAVIDPIGKLEDRLDLMAKIAKRSPKMPAEDVQKLADRIIESAESQRWSTEPTVGTTMPAIVKAELNNIRMLTHSLLERILELYQ